MANEIEIQALKLEIGCMSDDQLRAAYLESAENGHDSWTLALAEECAHRDIAI